MMYLVVLLHGKVGGKRGGEGDAYEIPSGIIRSVIAMEHYFYKF